MPYKFPRTYEWHGEEYTDVTCWVRCGSVRRIFVGWKWGAARQKGWAWSEARAKMAVEDCVTYGKPGGSGWE